MAPPQVGRLRSATGRYRTEGVPGPAVGLLSPTGEAGAVALDRSGQEGDGGTGTVILEAKGGETHVFGVGLPTEPAAP